MVNVDISRRMDAGWANKFMGATMADTTSFNDTRGGKQMPFVDKEDARVKGLEKYMPFLI